MGGDVSEQTRRRFHNAWQRSDGIFDLVPRERWLDTPIRLRHPLLFYVGHLPAFAWNQLGSGLLGHEPADPRFDQLFAFGIDPIGVDGHEAEIEWPTVDEVLAYRDEVRARLLDAVDEVADLAADHVMAARGRIFHLVLEHEYMHHETLQYMLQQIEPGLKRRPGDAATHLPDSGCETGFVPVAGGDVVLGAEFEDIEFGWDNEFPSQLVSVGDFEIGRTLVRNFDWLEFLEAGGYDRAEWWQAEDWAWRERVGLSHPTTWSRGDGGWSYRTMFEELTLEAAGPRPVMVSLAEARAFCRWRGVRLPTEAELHRALYGSPGGSPRRYPWGDQAPQAGVHGNFDFSYWTPTPVGSFPDGASAWGLEDAIGNLWQWTSTPFRGLPGFEAYIPGYEGYSADFFDDRHFVMLGASWATPAPLIRRSFRNWFQDHYPFAFAGFRTVREP
jgi:ergothioneine biosynthesis protein EgtB